jgi:DNA-binding NarL/FixJ family response regulator
LNPLRNIDAPGVPVDRHAGLCPRLNGLCCLHVRFKDEVLAFTGRPGASGKEDPVFATLSPREREILVRIAQGCTNAQIGEQLFISEKTVRNHITRIFEKLGVSTRAQAIVLAKDKNLAG